MATYAPILKPGKASPKYPVNHGVKTYPDGREECVQHRRIGRIEYRRRVYEMADRQGGKCAMCQIFFTGYMQLTFDQEATRRPHIDERLLHEDGVTWRNAALCNLCNCEKGSRRFHWIDGNTAYVPVEGR
jgi:hypothetical protein